MRISSLATTDPSARALLGGKAASLSRLMEGRMPVPAGFGLTTTAYLEHAQRSGLDAQLQPLLARRAYEEAASTAKRLLVQTPLEEDLENEIAAQWAQLGSPPVAVRSSASSEDLSQVSFAGQYDSFLNVSDYDSLILAIKRCWASLWSERVIRYRSEQGIVDNALAMGVIVQAMVPADAAGVIFTVDPLSQDPQRLLVEVAPGLGEAVVSGRTRGETGLIDRSSEKLRAVGSKLRLLTPPQCRELCELALRIEAAAGSPQDIEFALSKGKIWILQARPITTLAEPVPAPPPLSYVDRRMQKLTLERYAVAPRPLDNIVFTRMVGAAVYAAQQFGLRVDEHDFAQFRGQLWHQQYRFPRSHLTLRLFLHPLHEFGMLRKDWLSWWTSGPRETLESLSALGDIHALSDASLFEKADTLLRTWEELTNRRFYAVSSVNAEAHLHHLVALAVGPRAAAKTTGALLSGIPSPTNLANNALWELSRIAREDPAVAAAIRQDRWDSLPEYGPFFTAQKDYFAHYGHRESGGFYLSQPTWRHDPTPFRQLLRTLIDADSRPVASESAHLDARKKVERRLRYFPWLRRRFTALLEQVRALHRMREESHFDLTRPLDALQDIVAELGQRLQARGHLEKADDVFFLSYDEVRTWLLSGPPPDVACKEFIRKRRATHRLVNARWQRNRPQPPRQGKRLRGTSAAPGRFRGRARIVLDESQFDQLRPGEILVCPHSNPSWTPLFLTAAAVVSETGGPASHAAIVAREYGLPAVLAVSGATRLIRNGDLLDVDGDSGRVTLLGQVAK